MYVRARLRLGNSSRLGNVDRLGKRVWRAIGHLEVEVARVIVRNAR